MLETLTILPMAPGTRSRRADVLHRATPVLLPKPKQRQTTLDQHLHSGHHAPPTRAPPPPQRPPRQQRPLQHPSQPPPPTQQPLHSQLPQQPQQTQLPFAIAAPTRSIQNILNHASSTTSTRPKRKIAADADASANGKGNVDADADADAMASDSAFEAALRKRPRLAVEIVDYAKPLLSVGGSAASAPAVVPQAAAPVPPAAVAALPPPRNTTTGTKTKTHTAASPSATPAPFVANTTALPVLASASSSCPTAANAAVPGRQYLTAPDKNSATTPSPLPTTTLASTNAPSTASQPRPAGRPPSKTTSQLAAAPKDKAVNGFIKQELKGLQLTAADAVAVASAPREGGRKLRSQEATRFKSDLSAYFPDYDEVIGNEPKEEHILNIDTPILLVESSAAYPATLSSISSTPLAASLRSSDRTGPVPVKGYGDKLFYDVFDSHVLDFTFLGNQHKSKGAVDPLPDSYFETHHKRAERLERSIRNTEKGRAQHEKDQIIRLLDGLQGPDWLRTMGVSGITESKKKTFEPAREHFIRGCRAILEKFRLWSLEEKRRKLEKDRAHAEEVKAREAATETGAREHRGKGRAKASHASHASTAAEGGLPKSRKRRDASGKDSVRANENDDGDDAAEPADEAAEDEDGDGADGAGEDDMDDDSQPDSSDFDAVIAAQLREEALARSRLASKAAASNKRRKTRRSSSSTTNAQDAAAQSREPSPPPPPPPPAEEEVTSFFRKRYQRDAALSRGRRKGRTVMAWGQPVPEPPETDFHLPGEILDKAVPRGPGRRKRGGSRGGTRGGARGGARGAHK